MAKVTMTVNNRVRDTMCEPRVLLIDVLRDRFGLSSVHASCEQGSCGTCTVLLDGVSIRSCLLFAVQADGCQVTTVEGLATGSNLHPLQEAFAECHAVQCGFCTPAMLLAATELLQQNPRSSRGEIEDALSGQLCRCTGYVSIVDAVELAAQRMRDRTNA